MVDVASGEALVNETLTQARESSNNTTQYIQHIGTRNTQLRKVNQISLGPSVET